MKIEFIQVKRDCPQNRVAAGKLIYDYNVIIDGEHRATFRKRTAFQGYFLQDANEQPVNSNPNPTGMHHSTYAFKQADFQRVLEEMLKLDRIPTIEQCEALRREQCQREEADKAESERISKIQAARTRLESAAPELLAAAIEHMKFPNSKEVTARFVAAIAAAAPE